MPRLSPDEPVSEVERAVPPWTIANFFVLRRGMHTTWS